MKTILCTLVISCCILSSFAEEPKLKLDIDKLTTLVGVRYKIDTESPRNMVVTLRDQEHRVLYQKAYSGAQHYRGIVNMESANDGFYYLEVRQGDDSIRRRIHLTHEKNRIVQLKE